MLAKIAADANHSAIGILLNYIVIFGADESRSGAAAAILNVGSNPSFFAYKNDFRS